MFMGLTADGRAVEARSWGPGLRRDGSRREESGGHLARCVRGVGLGGMRRTLGSVKAKGNPGVAGGVWD
jgi:hypothetical protein